MVHRASDLLFAICVAYTVANLEFVMDRNSSRRHAGLQPEFPGLPDRIPDEPDLVAVVESEDPEKTASSSNGLPPDSNWSPPRRPHHLLTDVFFKGDLKLMGRRRCCSSQRPICRTQVVMADYRPSSSSSPALPPELLFAGVNRAIVEAGRKPSSTPTR